MTKDLNEIYKNPNGKVLRVISTQPTSFRKSMISEKKEKEKEEQLSTLNFGEMLDEEVKKLRKKG